MTSNTGQLLANTQGSSVVQATAKATGVGPSPFYTSTPNSVDNPSSPAGFAQATCTASSPTTQSGNVTISMGWVDTKLDANGNPVTTVPVPSPVPTNDRVDFTVDNVGDHGHMVFNERINNPDGSLTATPHTCTWRDRPPSATRSSLR